MTTTPTQEQQTTTERQKNLIQKTIPIILRTLITCAIIIGGIYAARHLFMTAPVAGKKPHTALPALVKAEPVKQATFTVHIEAFGTVEPARSINITPQVSGNIISIHPDLQPGGQIAKDQIICTLDPTDYKLAVQQRTADLLKAESSLSIEEGRRDVAKREYDLLGQSASPEDLKLIMREPQLQTAEANIMTAEASLNSAKINLDRTTIRMPFNAIVQSKNADLGMLASQGTNIASVIGTDNFWIRLLVPTRDLQWIFNNQKSNPSVKVFNDFAWEGKHRDGELLHLITDLDKGARMAQVLISVNDPLALESTNKDQPQLLIGMYARTRIEGPTLNNVFTVPNSTVRENNTIWVITPDKTLDIRTITPIWQDKDNTVFRGTLKDGDKLITSSIITPVQDMKLELTK